MAGVIRATTASGLTVAVRCDDYGTLLVRQANVGAVAGAPAPIYSVPEDYLEPSGVATSPEPPPLPPRSSSMRKSSSRGEKTILVHSGKSGADWFTRHAVEAQATIIVGECCVHSLELTNLLGCDVVFKLYDCTLEQLVTPHAASRASMKRKIFARGIQVVPNENIPESSSTDGTEPQVVQQHDEDELDPDPFSVCQPSAEGDSDRSVFSCFLLANERRSFQFPAGVHIRHGIVIRASGPQDGEKSSDNGNCLVTFTLTR